MSQMMFVLTRPPLSSKFMCRLYRCWLFPPRFELHIWEKCLCGPILFYFLLYTRFMYSRSLQTRVYHYVQFLSFFRFSKDTHKHTRARSCSSLHKLTRTHTRTQPHRTVCVVFFYTHTRWLSDSLFHSYCCSCVTAQSIHSMFLD